jgi:hypothetical protein
LVARRILRGVFISLAVLAGLCVVLIVGAWLWVRSDAGQRYVLDRLRQELGSRAGVEIEASRLSGSLLSSLRLEGVTLRACEQKLRVSAASATIDFSIVSIVRGAPRVAMIVDEPVVGPLAPGDCASPPERKAARPPKRIDLEHFAIHRGSVKLPSGKPPIEIHAIEVDAHGVIVPDGVSRVQFRAAAEPFSEGSGSTVQISGTVASDGIDVDVQATVAKDDIPRSAGVRGPVAAQVKVTGTPAALRVEGELKPQKGVVRVSGTIDAVDGSADLALEPSGVSFSPAVGESEVTASGQVRLQAKHDQPDSVHLDVRGHGEYSRRVIDPSLVNLTKGGGAATMNRHSEQMVGGHWNGHLEGRAGEQGLDTELRIELDPETKGGPTTLLVGTLVMRPGGKPRLEAKVIARDAKRTE